MYKIILPNFEGPFDLLLYFIKRDELNIYDIPISKITEEFLNYIKLMQYFDLELAGEFILMSSTLMYIKAQMLLPRPKSDDESEIEDPRTGLVRKLLEYKVYKDAAYDLQQRAEDNKYVYYKKLFDVDKSIIESSAEYKNTNLFELIKAFKIAIDRSNAVEPQHLVNLETVTIEDKKVIILDLLKNKSRLTFHELTTYAMRSHIIVTFLAILELMKYQKIWIFQDNNFDDIIITDRSYIERID
jgi:segregation and condensation protein A